MTVVVKYRPKIIPRVEGSIDSLTYKKDQLLGIQTIPISTDQNNLVVNHRLQIILFNCTSPSDLTGIEAPSPVYSCIMHVRNTGAEELTLQHNSSESLSTNRFFCPGNIPLVLSLNEGGVLVYDTINTRWTVLSYAKTSTGISGLGEFHVPMIALSSPVSF